MIKWYENKCIHRASAFFTVAAAGIVKKRDAKEKSYIDVSLSDMVLDYSTSMEGVDLADMLIALYGTKIMDKERWYFKVIFHALDICKINGWLIYRRHGDQEAVPKQDQKSLLAFVSELVEALTLARKSNSICGKT